MQWDVSRVACCSAAGVTVEFQTHLQAAGESDRAEGPGNGWRLFLNVVCLCFAQEHRAVVFFTRR